MPSTTTLARVTPYLVKYGVTRLARITGLDSIGIPVWNAVSPNARSIVINQGKGIEDIDAKVSAAMEALERALGGEPEIETRFASRDQLSSAGQTTEPLDCLIGAGNSDLGGDEEIDWASGFDVASRQAIWVPYDAILLDHTRKNRFWQSSDGLASGNTMQEAILHGLLERIERDAEILWQFSSPEQRSLSCFDPHSMKDPVLSALARRIEAAGFTLRTYDMTSDIGIACVSALIAPRSASGASGLRYVEISNGSGAHISPARAAIRAVTEAAQSRLTYISGARDDIYPDTFSRLAPAHIVEDLALHQHDFARWPKIAAPPATVKDKLDYVIEQLKSCGIDSIVAVPLNPQNEVFSVVKMFVPQLENPHGARKRKIGSRAVAKILALR